MFTEQILIFFDSGFYYSTAGASPSVSQCEICFGASDEKGGPCDVTLSPSARHREKLQTNVGHVSKTFMTLRGSQSRRNILRVLHDECVRVVPCFSAACLLLSCSSF